MSTFCRSACAIVASAHNTARSTLLAASAACIMLAASSVTHAQTRVGEVDTTFRLIGPNDQVTVERYDDPAVENVSCYVSRAVTGGVRGAIGIAENPSRFSIACRATGTPRITRPINQTSAGEVIFNERQSLLFKELRVSRFYDSQRHALIYLVWSTRLVDGSPFNAVTAIALAGPLN